MDITAKEISAFLATSGIEFEYRGGGMCYKWIFIFK